MRKVFLFLNKHRWKIYPVWVLAGFVIWTYVGILAWEDDPDAPGGIYIFLGWIMWFLLHVIPTIFLAFALGIWRWRQAKILKIQNG